MHRTVQAHILYIFKINRANLAKTHWGGLVSLVCRYRETHHQPFIRTASQPLLNLTSSQSPLNTYIHTLTHTHTQLTQIHPHRHSHTPRPPPPRICTKPERPKKETKQPLNVIIKHVNAIFFWNASQQESKAGGLVSDIIRPVSGEGLLDDTTMHMGG